MTLSNRQIADNVNLITTALITANKPKATATELQFMQAGADLVSNLLQNLNDISLALKKIADDGVRPL